MLAFVIFLIFLVSNHKKLCLFIGSAILSKSILLNLLEIVS